MFGMRPPVVEVRLSRMILEYRHRVRPRRLQRRGLKSAFRVLVGLCRPLRPQQFVVDRDVLFRQNVLFLVKYRDGFESLNASSLFRRQVYFNVESEPGGFPVWSVFHFSRNLFERRYVLGLDDVYVLSLSIRRVRSLGLRPDLVIVPAVERHDRRQVDVESFADPPGGAKTDPFSVFRALNGPAIASNPRGEVFLGQAKPHSKPTHEIVVNDRHEEVIVFRGQTRNVKLPTVSRQNEISWKTPLIPLHAEWVFANVWSRL